MKNKSYILIFIILMSFIFSFIFCYQYEPDLGIHVDKKLFFEENKINSLRLKKIVHESIKEFSKFGYTDILMLDSNYNIPKLQDDSDKNDIKDLLIEFDNAFKYKKNIFDCDKFSRLFQSFSILSNYDIIESELALSVGVLNFYYTNHKGKISGHSINILIYVDNRNSIKVRLLEPQSLGSKFVRDYISVMDKYEDKKKIIFQYSTMSIKDYFKKYNDVYVGLVLF